MTQVCPGCGVRLPPGGEGTHAYMASSTGCWARFNRLLAREFGDSRLMAVHQLTVDAYAVQHPGTDDRRAIQSVGIHLARLGMQLRGASPGETGRAMTRFAAARTTLPRLDPPAGYALTVADVPLEGDADAHAAAVRAWAAAAWAGWSAHHGFVERWAADVLG